MLTWTLNDVRRHRLRTERLNSIGPRSTSHAFGGIARTNVSAKHEYFANQFGRAVVAVLSRAMDLRGRVVCDYGCGPGYLAPHLFEMGAKVAAVDFSITAVDEANARFGGKDEWMGAKAVLGIPVDLPDALGSTRSVVSKRSNMS